MVVLSKILDKQRMNFIRIWIQNVDLRCSRASRFSIRLYWFSTFPFQINLILNLFIIFILVNQHIVDLFSTFLNSDVLHLVLWTNSLIFKLSLLWNIFLLFFLNNFLLYHFGNNVALVVNEHISGNLQLFAFV